jgi:hypothetical protein
VVSAPVARNAADERELILIMMRWGSRPRRGTSVSITSAVKIEIRQGARLFHSEY